MITENSENAHNYLYEKKKLKWEKTENQNKMTKTSLTNYNNNDKSLDSVTTMSHQKDQKVR